MITAFGNANLPSGACQAPDAIKTTQAMLVDAETASLSWKAIEFESNPVVGYWVEYRAIETEVEWSGFGGNPVAQQLIDSTVSVVVGNLSAAALYEFRVRPVLTDDCAAIWDAVFPKLKLPPVTPFTDPNFYTWLQPVDKLQSASPADNDFYLRASPLEDATQFIPQTSGAGFINGVPASFAVGVPVLLDRSDYADFPASSPTVLQADRAATVFCWERNISGLMIACWSPARPWHLSTDLIFGAFREATQIFHIYSLSGTAPVIEVWKQASAELGDVLQTTLAGVSGNVVRYQHSDGSDVYGFRSDDPIVLFHFSRTDYPAGALDQKPINPPALRLVMGETRNAAIAARYDGTAPTAMQSDVGEIGSVPVSRAQSTVYPGAPAGGGQYSGLAVTFDGGNLPIVGGPGADGDGTAQTLGQDVDTLGSSIRVPGTSSQSWQYLKVASPFPFSLTQTDQAGLVVNTWSSSGVGPYVVYLSGSDVQPNHLYQSDQPSIFVIEETQSDDEIVLWSL